MCPTTNRLCRKSKKEKYGSPHMVFNKTKLFFSLMTPWGDFPFERVEMLIGNFELSL